jgi:hypothetical protein
VDRGSGKKLHVPGGMLVPIDKQALHARYQEVFERNLHDQILEAESLPDGPEKW